MATTNANGDGKGDNRKDARLFFDRAERVSDNGNERAIARSELIGIQNAVVARSGMYGSFR